MSMSEGKAGRKTEEPTVNIAANARELPAATDPLPNHGNRPECFKSTVQETLFVLTATMAIAMSSFTTGSTTVISNFIARDLHMTTAEITWINAASSYASIRRLDEQD